MRSVAAQSSDQTIVEFERKLPYLIARFDIWLCPWLSKYTKFREHLTQASDPNHHHVSDSRPNPQCASRSGCDVSATTDSSSHTSLGCRGSVVRRYNFEHSTAQYHHSGRNDNNLTRAWFQFDLPVRVHPDRNSHCVYSTDLHWKAYDFHN